MSLSGQVGFDAGFNFRDVGSALASKAQGLLPRRLYRSGALTDLAPQDMADWRDLDIGLICDLRSKSERRAFPTPQVLSDACTVWTRSADASAGDIVRILQSPEATAETGVDIMRQTYRELPETVGEPFCALIRHFAQEETPALVHCAAGKDRTGALVAILLDLVGVPRALIEADYLETNGSLTRIKSTVRQGLKAAGVFDIDQGVWDPVMRAEAQYLQTLFEAIEARDGTTMGYARRWLKGEEAALTKALRYLSAPNAA